MAQRIPEPTIPFSCSPRGWICSPGQSLPPASALVPVMSCFLRFSLRLLFNSSQPTDGTKKLHSVSFPGTEAPLDLKTYSLFPTLSLNVPFVLQKEFQAHLQSVELGWFLFLQMYPAALLLCCRGFGMPLSGVWGVGFQLAPGPCRLGSSRSRICPAELGPGCCLDSSLAETLWVWGFSS